MRRRLSLLLVVVVWAGTAGVATGEVAAPLHVDSAVQVTTDMAVSRAHTVPAIAADPRDQKVLAMAEADAYSSQCSIHVSVNAGLSWTAASRPTLPPEYPNCSFVYFGPVVDVTFGSDGTLYYAFSGYNPTTKKGRVFLARSTDLGSTWDTTPLPWIAPNLQLGETGIDASPSVAVDPEDPERVFVGWGSNWATYTLTPEVLGGKLYYWDVIERVYVAVSTDGGRTFGDAIDAGEGLRLTPQVEGVKPPPQVIAGNDGEIHVLFGEYSRAGSRDSREGTAPPAHVYLSTSRDSGRTWDRRAIYTAPTPTATSDWIWVPKGDIDRKNGTFYVAWEDMTTAEEPVQISTIRSTDGGRTWSEPVKANDATPKRKWNYPEAYPELSVAPNGRVDLAWYDGRNDPAFVEGARSNKFQDVYYTSSTDGGRSWAPNLRVNDRIIDRSFGPSSQGGIRGPVGLASLDEVAYLAWDDSRNGRPDNASQDIYFTRARTEAGAELFEASSSGTSGLAWALLGAAIALVVGGMALGAGVAATRRRPSAEPASTPVGAGVGS